MKPNNQDHIKRLTKLHLNYEIKSKIDIESLLNLSSELLKKNDMYLYSWAMYILCEYYLKSRNHNAYLPYFAEFQKVADNRQGYPAVYCLILDALYSMHGKRDIDTCLENAEKALLLYRESKLTDQFCLFQIYYVFGMAYNIIGDFENAYRNFIFALQCKLHKPFIFMKGSIYDNLGNLELRFEYHRAALNHFQKSAEIFKKYSLDYEYHGTLNQIAALQLKLNLFDKALVTLQEAQEYFTKNKLEHTYEALLAQSLFGIYYIEKADYEKAKEHILPLLKEQNPFLISNAHRDLAHIYTKMNEIDKAYKHYLEAVELDNKGQYIYGVIDIYICIAKMFIESKNYEKANEYIDKTETIMADLDSMRFKLRLYETQIGYYKGLENYKETVHYFELYTETLKKTHTNTLQTIVEHHEIKSQIALSY